MLCYLLPWKLSQNIIQYRSLTGELWLKKKFTALRKTSLNIKELTVHPGTQRTGTTKKEKKKERNYIKFGNRPSSIYQYSNMATRFSRQFGVPFFVSKSLLGIERQKGINKFVILPWKPRSHVRILIHRPCPIQILQFKSVSLKRALETWEFGWNDHVLNSHNLFPCKREQRTQSWCAWQKFW